MENLNQQLGMPIGKPWEKALAIHQPQLYDADYSLHSINDMQNLSNPSNFSGAEIEEELGFSSALGDAKREFDKCETACERRIGRSKSRREKEECKRACRDRYRHAQNQEAKIVELEHSISSTDLNEGSLPDSNLDISNGSEEYSERISKNKTTQTVLIIGAGLASISIIGYLFYKFK